MAIPSIIVLDVNETLLDIESVAPFFERVFGEKAILREWFNQVVLYSNAITLADTTRRSLPWDRRSSKCWAPSTASP